MNTNSSNFSHEEISSRAEKIWRESGRPVGRDTEIWYEAERQIALERSGGQKGSDVSRDRMIEETAEESMVEYNISPAIPTRDAVKAALQKKDTSSSSESRAASSKRSPNQPNQSRRTSTS